MQIILVSASYAIWAGMLGYTGMIWKKEQTPFYFLMVLAAAVGGLFEPLYDEALMLYFYSPGIWSLFTSFDIPQPIWVYSGYVTLYASIAVCLVRDVQTNAPKAIHRTALSLEGRKIEVGGHDRQSLGPVSGGAIKLTPDSEVTTCRGGRGRRECPQPAAAARVRPLAGLVADFGKRH